MRQPFPILRTVVDRNTTTFQENHQKNAALIAEMVGALAVSREGGGQKYVDRHRERGKLLARERIELLLDRDSFFLELCPLAGHGMRGVTTGAGVIGGVGLVSGVECLITANDPTVKGGAINEIALQKSLRLGEIAVQNRLVAISLTESAGADLPNQSKIFVPGGATFRGLTQRSKQRIPTICLVFGSSTAGGAYLPGMSDYVIMVDKQAQVYLAGPPLVRMATGEVSDHEQLGGARMHSQVSGVADYLAANEVEAIRLGREIVAHLQWKKTYEPEVTTVEPPRHDAEDLLGIVSPDHRVPYDVREVIGRIVDGSRFSEFKPLYGSTLVCGWAQIHGYPVGILANNGILFSESANKGAQFIALCNQVSIPLIFLQNITGFMVGRQYEEQGIIKNGAKLINAVSNSEVPAITIMLGASYGAGNYGMSGRAYQPRFLFSWPTHRIAVMGGEQLAGVLEIIQRESAEKKGESVDEKQLAMAKAMVEHQINQESAALFASARIWDDGIIDPRDTRTVLAITLSAVCNAPVVGTTSWGVFRH